MNESCYHNEDVKDKMAEQIISGNTIDLLRTNQLTGKHYDNYSWKQLTGYGYCNNKRGRNYVQI